MGSLSRRLPYLYRYLTLSPSLPQRTLTYFVGNLSSDKVSKRDVFDVFHRFGRLAQISLKSAYGFVQYHDVDEGRRAMDNLQGVEIKGRRIRKYLIFISSAFGSQN
jgi:RNA recognition motif-containing protein